MTVMQVLSFVAPRMDGPNSEGGTNVPGRRGWIHFYRAALLILVHAAGASMSAHGADADPTGPTGILRAEIIDEVSGLPTACNVSITDAQGHLMQPHPGYKQGFRCTGRFEHRLPAGPTRVKVTRGFETSAFERSVDIPAGGRVDLRISLARQVDLRKRGWYAGDSHVHMLHGEKTIPVTFDDVALAARAEDLQYLSLAQAWAVTNPTPEHLASELAARSSEDCVLTWNLEAPKNYFQGDAGRCLGHCWTLNAGGRTPGGEDTISLLLGASAHDYESEKPTYANYESHALIHSQGGAVFYTHPARWWIGAWGGRGRYPKKEAMRVSNMAVELPVDTLLGPTFDGIDLITTQGEFGANKLAFELWCLLLNRGYRLAGTASSDACFDRPAGATPGAVRTYTYVEGNFSLEKVTRAMVAGRNFATSGPLLLTSLGGAPPGDVQIANGAPHQLKIEAWPSGSDTGGLSRIEILKNGTVSEVISLPRGTPSASTNWTLTAKENAWYCVRAFGSDPQAQRAISGAFYFAVPDARPPEPVSANVKVVVKDAATSAPLSGELTELYLSGPLITEGKRHVIRDGATQLTVPGTCRLRLEVEGYRGLTLSPFLDDPELLPYITRLRAEDLLRWETFEKVRELLGSISLTFLMEKETADPR